MLSRDPGRPRRRWSSTPREAEDQNGFAVTTAFAAEHGVGTLSDLADLAPELTFGGPPECPDRPFCLPGPRGGLRPASSARC